ncbi:MAG TPA: 3-ketoacyl-ACP reductase [Opitutaceae bacterium]|jgi:NAD(P)-dependent dehydrogenase (short-subunit alcohol dehydrogenase family)|nr:3-ketoacyl-ACP reductase [Opitutaceae bacterium]
MTKPRNDEPVVLVTGASRGLGRGIAVQLAAAGCSVAVNYAGNVDAAEQTAALCRRAARSRGQRFLPVQADIGAKADRARLVATVLDEIGRIDALVNNAGIAPIARADLTESTEESFDRLISVNLRGPHFLTQAVVRHWLSGGTRSLLPGGFKVIFVTSISADTASVNRGEYCMSKAGLAMSAQLWAARLAGDGIQVFDLRPGIMATDMTAAVKRRYDKLMKGGVVPQRRWGTGDDVGLAVRAIVTGHFPFSTGAVIPIDGGLHLRRL